MKAVVIANTGGIDSFEIRDVPRPEPRGEQLLVRVFAAGVNRADLMQARGRYPAPPGSPSDIPGLEFAGEVAALGPDCVGPWQAGDRVCGIVGGGGLAEYVLTHEGMAMRVPANLDYLEAGAIPESFLTSHDALLTQAHVQPGERVLIHAIAGGVGTAAVQLAHAMGCFVFGTTRSFAKLEKAKLLGLDVGIDATREDFADVIKSKTNGEGVQVIVDHVGASILASNINSLSIGGRLVLVGLLGGSEATISLTPFLRNRLTVVGTTLRARPLNEKLAATRYFARTALPWFERGLVRPVIDRTFPLDQIRDAQERMESNAGFGKIVIDLRS